MTYPYRTKSRKSWWNNWGTVMFGAVILLALLIGGISIARAYGTHHTVTTTVDDKERVCSSSGSSGGCKYLVYTEHGTYKITDSLFVGTTRFNSSDVYGRVKRCHKYAITYYGWRLGYFSSYPNIVTLKDLGADASCTQ